MPRTTTQDLAEQVAALTALVGTLVEARQETPADKPAAKGKGSRRNKPAAKGDTLTLAAGSTFEYLKGRKGSRKRWSTYQIVGNEDGRYLAVAAGSDSGFVSKWNPARVDESLPYVRNVKPA